MFFLNYNGHFDGKKNYSLFKFYFNNNSIFQDEPRFIIPPNYDILFKKIFFNNINGEKLLEDFLNSIFFPENNRIINLEFLYEKGSLIVDNACKVKLEKMKDPIILDIELQIGIKNKIFTQKFFDYACSLRDQNNYTETWVIALVIEKSEESIYDKSSKSYVLKQQKEIEEVYYLNNIKIYEVYLNTAFQKIKHNQKLYNLF